MKSLFFSYNTSVDKAYIIRIKDNKISENIASRCASSCTEVGQNWQYWDAYNGIEKVIQPPSHHNDVMQIIKVTDTYATRGEIACALSHISLWVKCVLDDKPLVVLEHDAIMVTPYTKHQVYNSIAYLGGTEQFNEGWEILPTPPHSAEGDNYHFICRAHAYAIDPAVAKNMLSYVIKFGITAPLDVMIRADIFPIHQMGIYAYDDYCENNTTIHNRPKCGRSTQRNDKLEI